MSIKARAGRTKSLNALINKDKSIIGQIFDRAAKLQQLETLVLQHLPEESRKDYRIGNFQQGKLVLFTTNALNLTRFRYFKPQLMQQLQQEFPSLINIEVKIRPASPQKKVTKKGKPISEQARQQIKQLAEEVEQPELKQALERLSQKTTSQQ